MGHLGGRLGKSPVHFNQVVLKQPDFFPFLFEQGYYLPESGEGVAGVEGADEHLLDFVDSHRSIILEELETYGAEHFGDEV